MESVHQIEAVEHVSLRQEIYLPRLIAILSLVLPLIILLAAGWMSWRTQVRLTRDHLEGQVNLALQHATRVFASFDLAAKQVEEATLELSDEEIIAQDAQLSARLDRLSSVLPEVEDIWVIDAVGHPLVTSGATPAPRGRDFGSEDFFQKQREPGSKVFISGRALDDARPTQYFKVSYRRQDGDNRFRGVIMLTGDPRSFEPFYLSMLTDRLSAVSLVRGDGAILARVPSVNMPLRLPENSPFWRAIQKEPISGAFVDIVPNDQVERMIVYRSLPNLPIYVSAAVEMSKVRMIWMEGLAAHLWFGLPATLALFIIALAAISQAKRQAITLDELQKEARRRVFAEEALRQANKMEAIGRLTGGVAHDFNNLLQVMLGRLSRIHKSAERNEPPTLRDIDAMQFAIDRAANLTHRLLAFSRQQPLQMKIVDVNQLIMDMSELVRQTAGNEIIVETIFANDLWLVAVDPNQLENAILNLTSNARDAMQEGGRMTLRTVNVTLSATTNGGGVPIEAGDYVRISLEDTGSGIPPDMVDKIFEPFFTTKPIGQGTGLGLSMVYGFLRQSGGHVSVESTLGQGTIVRLFLPRVVGEAAGTLAPDQEADDTRQQSGVILVVEDEVEVRRLVTDTLRDAGYMVLSAANAREGLRLIEDNPSLQILVTDIGLPEGVSGRDLAMRAREKREGLRVIFMTGYAQGGDIDLQEGDGLLGKPFSSSVLLQRVNEALATGPVAS